MRLSKHSFQVGDPAYLGEHRVTVLGRFRIVGSEQQRVWLDDDGHTIACDEADLQDIGAWSLARIIGSYAAGKSEGENAEL